jgi:arylsulfatase A-like enzyme
MKHPIIPPPAPARSRWLCCAALSLTLLAVGPIRAAEISGRPNVLFIAIDDLNDWVGFLKGHPQTRTPNMDRIAARGIVFANAQCAAPLCSPSRAAVFSGRQPFRSGVYGNDDDIRRIAPNLVLMPTQFKAQGYRTYGTGKLLHQHRPDLFDDSFRPEQRWSPFTPRQVDYTPEELPSKGTDNPRHVVDMGAGRKPVILPLNRMPSDRQANSPGGESFDWGPVDVPDAAMGDTQIVDWAVKKIGERSDAPFFLGVGFYRPHIPLFAPARYFEPFPADKMRLPEVQENDLDDLGKTGRGIALDPVTAGSHATVLKYNQWKPAVAAYLACVHFVDAQIGRLLAALESSPHAANTIIVLWGDHGWHLGEKQHWGKWTGWERATRTPLAIVPPLRDRARYAGGALSDVPVSLIDLYPTLMELCGIKPPATGLDGESLVPVLRDPQRNTGRAVVSTFYGEHYSVRDERWRYIRYADGSEELYDHRTDPNEFTNLAGIPEHAAVKKRLASNIPKDPVAPPADDVPRKKKKKAGGNL